MKWSQNCRLVLQQNLLSFSLCCSWIKLIGIHAAKETILQFSIWVFQKKVSMQNYSDNFSFRSKFPLRNIDIVRLDATSQGRTYELGHLQLAKLLARSIFLKQGNWKLERERLKEFARRMKSRQKSRLTLGHLKSSSIFAPFCCIQKYMSLYTQRNSHTFLV